MLCDRALLGGYVEGRTRLDAGVVRNAAREVLPQDLVAPRRRPWWPWPLAGALAAGFAGFVFWQSGGLPLTGRGYMELTRYADPDAPPL